MAGSSTPLRSSKRQKGMEYLRVFLLLLVRGEFITDMYKFFQRFLQHVGGARGEVKRGGVPRLCR